MLTWVSLIVASPPAKSIIDTRVDMYHDGRRMDSECPMNFDFSNDLKMLREQARKFLAGRCSRQVVRKVFEGGAGYDAELWAEIARMGWLGTAVPEPYGGSGVGYDGLCLLAEELGYVLAPVPFSSSIYLAAEAIMIAGSEAQKQKLLPPMIDGSRIGTVALAEGMGNPSPEHIKAKVASGHLTGTKMPVPDGEIAHFAVVAARDEEMTSASMWSN